MRRPVSERDEMIVLIGQLEGAITNRRAQARALIAKAQQLCREAVEMEKAVEEHLSTLHACKRDRGED